VRWRGGRPLEARALLRQLHEGPGQREPRQALYLELQMAAAAAGAVAAELPRWSAWDFVGVQRESLRAIARWLDAALPPRLPGRA
jgi:hypothetical protein